MVSVLASNAVDRGLESRSGKTKDYKIDNMVSVLALNAVDCGSHFMQILATNQMYI